MIVARSQIYEKIPMSGQRPSMVRNSIVYLLELVIGIRDHVVAISVREMRSANISLLSRSRSPRPMENEKIPMRVWSSIPHIVVEISER
jgi:hypothetical protein